VGNINSGKELRFLETSSALCFILKARDTI